MEATVVRRHEGEHESSSHVNNQNIYKNDEPSSRHKEKKRSKSPENIHEKEVLVEQEDIDNNLKEIEPIDEKNEHHHHENLEINEGKQQDDGEVIVSDPAVPVEEKKSEIKILYPSLHEIVKHVDEKNQEANPEAKSSIKEKGDVAGTTSCRKCLIQ